MRRLALLSLLFLSTSALAGTNDLSVGWIARLPRIDYVWNSTNPTREGWPAEGSTVTWVANVRWLGDVPLKGVTYRWTIDGVEARNGTLDFAAGSLVQAELPWTWTFTRHEIAFEIDSDHVIQETEERNNRLLVYSNAISIGLYAERTFWNTLSSQLAPAGIGATTFDDWMQVEVRRLNQMAQYAIYPETPDGVLERWRIDDIHVVDDGALPLTPPYSEARDWSAPALDIPGLYPNVHDHTVDVQWGFPTFTASWFLDPSGKPWDAGRLTVNWSLLHEFQHARTMIDTYAWDVTPAQDNIGFSPLPPAAINYYYYTTPFHGMMDLEWNHFDRYTAVALNRMLGQRATQGNYNEPWNLGWFLNDFASDNRIRLLRPDGTPIANKKVTLYRPTGASVANWSAQPYAMTYDDAHSTQMTTDAQGRIDVGHNPFADGRIFAFVEKANGVVVVRVDDGTARRWAYLNSLEFNMAYWAGQTDVANMDVTTDPPRCRDSLEANAFSPHSEEAVSTRDVTFTFSADQWIEYDLFWTVDGSAPTKVDVPASSTGRASVTLTLPPGHIVWWWVQQESSDPPCPLVHSSIYAFDHLSEMPKRRAAHR